MKSLTFFTDIFLKMFKKNVSTNPAAELISFRKDLTFPIDRVWIFRYAKFISQTAVLYTKISKNLGIKINENLISVEKILRLPLARDSFDNNKLLYREILKMWENGFSESGPEQKKYYLEQLYLLNCIYALRFIEAIRQLGVNGHEKNTFLYLAQRNYREKILLNFRIKKQPNFVLKEFDAIIINHDKNILVEDKTRLEKDTLQQIFGYNSKKYRISHKDVLCNKTLCILNDLPEITHIEIIYTQVDRRIFRDFPKFAAQLIQKSGNYSQSFSLQKLMDLLCYNDGKLRKGFQELLKNTSVREVIFTKIDPEADLLTDKILHPIISQMYLKQYTKKVNAKRP